MPSAYPIFISYRRSDLSLEAEWLANLLRAFFGDAAVFFDREEIASGLKGGRLRARLKVAPRRLRAVVCS